LGGLFPKFVKGFSKTEVKMFKKGAGAEKDET